MVNLPDPRMSSHPAFLLHLSWPRCVRAVVVGQHFEVSSAPGAEVWAPSDHLSESIEVDVLVDGRPVLSAKGHPKGPRLQLDADLTITVSPLPLDAHLASSFPRLLGSSLAMRRALRQIDDARGSELPLLIRGETGTGKEVFAQSVHEGSARAGAPLIVIDCGAITESLLESELFGHVKGSFSGAATTRVGAFEAANGGTIFIDEVGELPPAMQPKLLRVLESGTFRRVGENHHRPSNVRVIAATHRDLRQMVAQGTFREDLYYRLAVLEASVPPLRERYGDLPTLIRSFVPPRVFEELTEAQWEALECHQWRGNVRELRNFAMRATLRGWEGLFDPAEPVEEAPSSSTLPSFDDLRSQPRLPSGVTPSRQRQEPASTRRLPVPGADGSAVDEDPELPSATDRAAGIAAYRDGESLADFRTRWARVGEASYLAAVLRAEQGSVVRAAARSQVDRTHFHRLLRRHGLAKASSRDSLVDTGEVHALRADVNGTPEDE